MLYNTKSTPDHVYPTAAEKFAFLWAEHFFQELREAYLKVKRGGFRRYDTDLEKLLKAATYAMPEGSKERDAFHDVDVYSIPDDYKACPEVAKQLNALSNVIFERDLLPSTKSITVDYLVREEYSLCPQFYTPAYRKWIRSQFKRLSRIPANATESPITSYINLKAEQLFAICSDNQQRLVWETSILPVLIKLANFEHDIIKLMKTQEDEHESEDNQNSNQCTAAELENLDTIHHLLTFAFEHQIKGPYRMGYFFELMKELDNYLDFINSKK